MLAVDALPFAEVLLVQRGIGGHRYRAVTVSFGYSGDSIVNSLADIGWMMLGFWIAGRLPWKASLALAVAFELFTLAAIRDNLTLNVLMLVWPIDAVRQWQATG